MTSTADVAMTAEVHAAPKAKVRNFSHRSRPHLPDAGGAAPPRGHPLYLFRPYRSEVVDRLRHDRARHRQLLHGDVLFPVRTVRLAEHRPEGTASHLRDRLLRLGLPFVICAFTIIPIAYYAISLRQHPEIGFAEFWWKTITVGPWPSGPIWFLWVLFGFDLVAWPAVSAVTPTCSTRSIACRCTVIDRPGEFFMVMFAVTAALYVPGRIHFGAGSWFEFGPFSVQHGRVLLYASLLLFRRRHRRREFRSRAAGGRRPAGEA